MEYPSYKEKSSSWHLTGGGTKEKVRWIRKTQPTRKPIGVTVKVILHPLIYTRSKSTLAQNVVNIKKRSRSSDKKTPAEEVLEAVLNPS